MLRTGTGGLAPRVTQQMQALVYQLNRKLQDAFVKADLALRDADPAGRARELLGHKYDVLGLTGMQKLLAELPPGERATALKQFAPSRRFALTQTGSRAEGDGQPDRAVQPKAKRPHVGALGAGAGVRDRAHRHVPRAPARGGRGRGGA